ncbi:AsnC family transcriptional regulator [Gilliamella sp. W8145]|nr:AsnC family transcriptional regulator [Gilliamella sp. W8145]
MDKKDHAILNQLRQNSRQSWREIGEKDSYQVKL